MGRGLFIIVAMLLGLPGVVGAEPEMRGAGVASSQTNSNTVALGEYRALIIGINDYASPDIWSPLQAARADAEALRDVLVEQYGFKPDNTQLLVDEAATREKIEGALYGLRKTTRPDDLIFIYFAGHGNVMGDPRDPDASCWIPYDAKSRTSCTDAVNHAVVRDLVKRFPARHTLVVADACFGGNLMEPTITRGTRGGAPVSYVRPLKLASKQILTSGVRKLEVSDKDPKTGHSPFASALLRSLRDSKGFVSTMDLTADVRRYYRDNQVKNEPVRGTMAGDAGGEFVFVRKEKLAEVRARVKSEREQIAELRAKLAEQREKLQIAKNIAQEKQRNLPLDTRRPSGSSMPSAATAETREQRYIRLLRDVQAAEEMENWPEAAKKARAAGVALNSPQAYLLLLRYLGKMTKKMGLDANRCAQIKGAAADFFNACLSCERKQSKTTLYRTSCGSCEKLQTYSSRTDRLAVRSRTLMERLESYSATFAVGSFQREAYSQIARSGRSCLKRPNIQTSPSGASIKLDGKTVGQTPAQIDAFVGDMVVLDLAGYTQVDRSIRLKSSAEFRRPIKLQPTALVGQSVVGQRAALETRLHHDPEHQEQKSVDSRANQKNSSVHVGYRVTVKDTNLTGQEAKRFLESAMSAAKKHIDTKRDSHLQKSFGMRFRDRPDCGRKDTHLLTVTVYPQERQQSKFVGQVYFVQVPIEIKISSCSSGDELSFKTLPRRLTGEESSIGFEAAGRLLWQSLIDGKRTASVGKFIGDFLLADFTSK